MFLVVQNAFAQPIKEQHFVVSHYGIEEGLPQSSVNDMLQAKSGYIWLATYGGLVRFDGAKFTTFNNSNIEGFGYDRILSVFESVEGGIWVLPEGIAPVILHFKDGVAEKFVFPGESKSRIEIYESDSETWLTVSGNSYKFINNRFVKVPRIAGNSVIGKPAESINDVWMFEESKIFYTTGDSVALVYELTPEHAEILGMIEYPKESGTLFLGTHNNELIKIEDGKQTVLKERTDFPVGKFLRFYSDGKNLFAIFGGKLLLWNGKKFVEFNFKADLPENLFIEGIIADNEGNYWLGTEGDGLFKLRPTAISMIDKDDGLENEKMLSLTKLKDGRMLFSTNNGGVYEWKNGKATLSSIHKYMDAVCNWSVFEDSKNNIWFGDATLYKTESLSKSGRYFVEKDGFNTTGLRAILEDSEGKIWIGTNLGVFTYDGIQFKNYTDDDGLYNNYINTLFKAKNGAIWVGTAYGVNRISDTKITKIELYKNGSDSALYLQPNIRSFYEDNDGAMWMGSYGEGLFRLKDGRVDHITIQNGLFDNVVSHLVLDEQDNFWMGSNRGISRVNRKELVDFFDEKIQQVKSYSYGIADGMNSAETNGGFSPSTISDTLGNIYFPTIKGVAVVATRQVKSNEVPPPVYIEKLRTVNGGLALSDLITLPYDNPFLEIEYTATSFSAPKKVDFKYRMLGLDDTWIDVKNRRVALYSKIPPGNYTFQVIASNSDGVMNTTGASISIEIVPPFWKRLWFIVFVSLFFISVVGLIFYYRILFLKTENEKQKRFSQLLIESQEIERRRIASELHDGLGQQILVIKNRAEMAHGSIINDDNLKQELNEIMESALLSIKEVHSISHGLRPVHLERFGLTDAIKNLCNQLKNTSKIEWNCHIDNIDDVLPKEKEINFYRVLQEGVKNILNHSSATEASIVIRRFDSEIRTIMSDNGSGFNQKENKKTGGLGFLGMRERVDTLGGTLIIDSTIGEGTAVKINFSIIEHE